MQSFKQIINLLTPQESSSLNISQLASSFSFVKPFINLKPLHMLLPSNTFTFLSILLYQFTFSCLESTVEKVNVLSILPDYLYLYNMDYCVTAPHGFLTSIMNRCRLYCPMPDTMCGSQTAEEILTLKPI